MTRKNSPTYHWFPPAPAHLPLLRMGVATTLLWNLMCAAGRRLPFKGVGGFAFNFQLSIPSLPPHPK